MEPRKYNQNKIQLNQETAFKDKAKHIDNLK